MIRKLAFRHLARLAAVAMALACVCLTRAASAQRSFTLVNDCSQTVWVGLFPPVVNSGGWALTPGTSDTVSLTTGFSGRIWGRRNCTFNSSGDGICETGDCGGVLACNGATGIAGTSLAEFTLNTAGNTDNYDVSYVDGFDFPLSITVSNTSCAQPTCEADVWRFRQGLLTSEC